MVIAAATFNCLGRGNEPIFLGLWEVFESVEVTNGAPNSKVSRRCNSAWGARCVLCDHYYKIERLA